MIEAKNIAIVAAGSASGGIIRYLISLFFITKGWNKFPLATFTVNIIGCFLIGIMYAVIEKTGQEKQQLSLFMATGFCGGFTTFSAFALENIQIIKLQSASFSLVYICLSVTLSIGAAFLGIFLFK